ncbi:MAG: MFS transporter [Opitutaceae bacterium]|nr:MFS transporter [Opitutaceae bacterium]
MSDAATMTPTRVRGRIIAVSMAMAFILYLDRICLAEIVKAVSFQEEVALSKEQIGRVLGVFFFSYALFQVPAGWASDRFGARSMLTTYIVLWSLFTALTGMVSSYPALMAMRLLCGAAEAGAYPTSGALIRRWMPVAERARASSMVTLGGRIGGTLAPFLTAWMVVSLGHWRPVLWIDGAVGLLVAAVYWHVVRDRPSDHPQCNAAERAHIGSPPIESPLPTREIGPVLWAFCKSRSLWLNASMQFLINIGWAFLITWLPTYLKEAKHVEPIAGGRMVTLVLACGMLGQIAGGLLSDATVRRFGLTWGRRLPLCLSGTLAGSAYIGCLFADTAWGVVGFCALVSFSVDMGTPAVWAFIQDIGGRVTAAAAGWANMWGNFGASLTATMVPTLLAYGTTSDEGQRYVFIACASSLFLAAIAALGLDASKTVWNAAPAVNAPTSDRS